MKSFALTALALGLSCIVASAFAQQCDQVTLTQTISSTPGSALTGNTCTDQGGNTDVSAVCSGNTALNGSGVQTYALVLGAQNAVSFVIAPTGAGSTATCTSANCPFDANLYVLNSTPTATTCGNQQCKLVLDTAVTGSGGLTANLPAGTYYAVVGDPGGGTGPNTADPLGCGPYSLTITGTLPVKLEKFSVD